MSIRTEKVSSLIRQEISRLFTNQFSDLSPNMITVTHVKMSDDLSVAKIHLSIWGRVEDVDSTFSRIEDRKRDIRFELSKSIKNHFKIMPELVFLRDDSMDYVEKIEGIFKKIREQDAGKKE